jgi:hypothetical protein
MPLIRVASVDNRATPVRRRPGAVLGFKDGPSPRGSTYYKTLLACPREHALSYEVGLEPTLLKEALGTGQLYHHCKELYYRAIQVHQQEWKAAWDDVPREEYLYGGAKEGMRQAYTVIEKLREEPGYKDTADELDRMLGGYFERYHMKDPWRIVAIEETVEYTGAVRYSSRYDLVVEDLDKHCLYLVEWKSARYITEDLVDNYQMDFQVLGQVWLLHRCVDLRRYFPFKGVIVGIATKQKTPKYERVEVMPSAAHLRAFEESLVGWSQVRDHMKFLNWPRALGHCAGYARGYSKCQFYDLCHGHPEMSAEDWKKLPDPPLNFERKELQP